MNYMNQQNSDFGGVEDELAQLKKQMANGQRTSAPAAYAMPQPANLDDVF